MSFVNSNAFCIHDLLSYNQNKLLVVYGTWKNISEEYCTSPFLKEMKGDRKSGRERKKQGKK
jgi:hypothetical protein